MSAYAWKANSRHKVPAQIAGDEISRIRSEKGEFFTPSDIVAESRDKDSPLHPEFEWNDKNAAIEYRKDQARHLVNHIVVIETETPKEDWVQAFVSVRTDDGPRYTNTEYAFSVPNMREDVLSQALADMRIFERKYRRYLDLAETVASFRRAVAAKGRKKVKSQVTKLAA